MTDDHIEQERYGGRLPVIDGPDLPEDARALSDLLHRLAVPFAEAAGYAPTTTDGRLIGPWNIQLHQPAHADGFNRWVQVDQQRSSLTPRVREIVVLAVGVAWNSDWVRYSHVAAARTVGLTESMITGLLEGRTNGEFGADEAAAHEFADSLARTHTVDDDVYRRAAELLGQDAVLDLTQLVSIYLATAAQLNAFRVPAPPIEPPITTPTSDR